MSLALSDIEHDEECLRSNSTELVWHAGSCHCGGVSFEVLAPSVIEAASCNCSICDMLGFIHLMVEAERFRLIRGGELLTVYRFNRGIAQHTFCRVCGAKPFYRPRSNPQGFSVNVRCLDKGAISKVELSEFDGRNWEENIASLRGERDDPSMMTTLDEARAGYSELGYCALPFSCLSAGAGTWRELSDLCDPESCPYDHASHGDVDEPAQAVVARFLVDGATAGSIPEATALSATRPLLEIVSGGEIRQRIRAIVGGSRDLVLRRCQAHVLETGGFIGTHEDVGSNPDYVVALVVGLHGEFEGGALRIETRQGTRRVELTPDTAVLMATDRPHQVEPVLRGRRRSLACFFAHSRE